MTSHEDQAPPPSYGAYPTELPATFAIGKRDVPPLVNVTELQAHLTLLGAFEKLKRDILLGDTEVTRRSKDEAWVVFVNRAVHRFYKLLETPWPTTIVASSETTMPPLDILLVWHSYLLVCFQLSFLLSADNEYILRTRGAITKTV